MNSPTSGKGTFGYVVGAVFVVYALVWKIPLPCFACDKGSFWYKCIQGTGEGTTLCSMHKSADNRFKTASGILDNAGDFAAELWEFTSEGLPDDIREFIGIMRDQILGLKNNIAERISLVIKFIREKIELFYQKAKDITVEAYERYLKRVIDAMIAFLANNIVSPIYSIMGKIVDFRDLVWRKLTEAVSKFTDIGIGDFIGEIVDVFKKIPEAIAGLKDNVVNMVNTVKNNLIGGIETGINKSAEFVERVVDSVSDLSDDIVDGAEGIVNNSISFINNRMNNVESVVNGISGGVEDAVNSTVKPVINKTRDTVESIRNLSFTGWKPFRGLPSFPSYGGLNIPELDIPDVGDVNFPDVEFSVDIPEVDLPDIPDINPDNISFPTIPGMGFISDKIENIKKTVRDIFETAMDPIYTAVASIALLAGNVKSAVLKFYDEFLSWESIKKRAGNILRQAKNGIEALKDFVFDNIIPGFLEILGGFKDALLEFIKNISEKSWIFLKKVGGTVGKMFKTVFKVLVKVVGAVAKAWYGTLYFLYGTVVDRATRWIPLPLTVRVVLTFAVIVWILAGQFLKNAGDIFNVAYTGAFAAVKALSDADMVVDKMFLGTPTS